MDPVPFRVDSPIAGTVIRLLVASGDEVTATTEVAIIESMKMEHPLVAGTDGHIGSIAVSEGDTVSAGDLLLAVHPGVVARSHSVEVPATSSTRADLDRLRERRTFTTDEGRPEAVHQRQSVGRRTARVNIDDLADSGSFIEYGALALAAQRRRRELDDLIARTPADGLVGGLATIGAELFGEEAARCAVASYDYTVLAGTQGFYNHRKKDRLFTIAERLRLPVVLFAEGGGGRPGDTDAPGVSGLDTMAFALFARLSGTVPLVGIASGYCFAGNAALLGCCDVVIATHDSNIGMAGPAMIEGGGLGSVPARDIGPIEVHDTNGVVDIVVPDEATAVSTARRYLSYFQGVTTSWTRSPDEALRDLVPEERTRIYDVRRVVSTLADDDSVTELRPGFGTGMITALVRIEGRPMGLIANNPAHLGGAIDSDAADKAARFVQLCDAWDLPVVSLCDTPGFMVGPDAERTAQVRHFSRLFVTAASSTVPWITLVLRKGYGLGAQAMAKGSFHACDMTVAWPSGEFGGMGIEGAVRLGYRRELDAEPDPTARLAREEELIARAYENGSAINVASHTEIDDVIDPAETRSRILAVVGPRRDWRARSAPKRLMIDTW